MTASPAEPRSSPHPAPHLRLLRRRSVTVVQLPGCAGPTNIKTGVWQASWADENIGDLIPNLWPEGAHVGVGGTPEKAKADMAAEITFAVVDDDPHVLLEALGELANDLQIVRLAVMRCGVQVRNTESAAARQGELASKAGLLRVAERWRRAWTVLTNLTQQTGVPCP